MGYLIGIIYLAFGAMAFWIERGVPHRAISTAGFAIGHSDVLTAAVMVAALAFALELFGAAHRRLARTATVKSQALGVAGRRGAEFNSRF